MTATRPAVPVTARGWAVAGGSLAVVAAGAGLGFRELHALGMAGLVLVALGLASVARSVTFAVERRVVPDRVTVGAYAECILAVTNEGRRRTATTLASDRVGDAGVELAVRPLAPTRTRSLPYPLPTDRRAVLDVGPLVVVRSDPLGLVERRTAVGGSRRLWVHPRVHAIGPLPQGRRRDLEGPTSDAARGDGVFHALREYVVGDDLRRIHWKATAHRGALIVREHADPARPDATVVLDDRRGVLDADGFELAVEVVASVTVASRRSGFPVRLLSTSGAVDAAASVDETALLDLLAAVGQHDHPGGDPVPRQVTAGGPAARALIAVTGSLDGAAMSRWAAAGRRFGETVLVSVADPGHVPRPPGGVHLLRARTADEFVAAWGRVR